MNSTRLDSFRIFFYLHFNFHPSNPRSPSCVCVHDVCCTSSHWVDFCLTCVCVCNVYVCTCVWLLLLLLLFLFLLVFLHSPLLHACQRIVCVCLCVHTAYNQRQLWKVINRSLLLSVYSYRTHDFTCSKHTHVIFLIFPISIFIHATTRFVDWFHTNCKCPVRFGSNRTLCCSLDALELYCLRRPHVSGRFVYSVLFFCYFFEWKSVVCWPNSLIWGINLTSMYMCAHKGCTENCIFPELEEGQDKFWTKLKLMDKRRSAASKFEKYRH